MAPRVTVLMGVHNGESYLDSAIESILNQSLADFEFIIIDDASSDGSYVAIERWMVRDERIRLVKYAQNRGLGHVLNEGVRLARGEFVARMDTDDVSMPHRLEAQVKLLDSYPEVDIVGSWAIDIDDSGERVGERRVPATHSEIADLIWTCPIIHPTVMFRVDKIRGVGSYSREIRRRQDYDLWFRCVDGGLRFANITEPLLLYRYSEDSLKRKNVCEMWNQVRIGLKGCLRIGVSPLVYVAVVLPLFEALLPNAMRHRLKWLKSRVDPRIRT